MNYFIRKFILFSRPYVCPFCEKTFANGSNCRSHKKKAHPVELAALEASGEVLPAANIPKLEHLQPKWVFRHSFSVFQFKIWNYSMCLAKMFFFLFHRKPVASENEIVIITQSDEKIIESIVYTWKMTESTIFNIRSNV